MAETSVSDLRVVVLIPVFNDWRCITDLLTALEEQEGLPAHIEVLIVDDGSTHEATPANTPRLSRLTSVSVLRLATNVGHQRAIAAGLVHLEAKGGFDSVLVMDADGEDSPSDCLTLMEASVSDPGSIAVAQRTRRSEGMRFRILYFLYQWCFRMLTGQRIDFGNFSVVPGTGLRRLVYMPQLWNHYPAAVMQSRIDVQRVPTERGQRFSGESRMNFISLVNHGLAGVAAFADTVYARLLAFSVFVTAVLGAGVIAGVVFRLQSESPLPGWLALGATAAILLLFQIIGALVMVSLLTLSMRAQPVLPPLYVAPRYIQSITDLEGQTLESNDP